MDSVQIVSHGPGVSATPVKPVIGRASTPLALYGFSQVSFDKFGHPQPLPPGLGDLPLYPDNDGFFSVNGPLDLTVFSPHAAPALVNTDNHSSILPLITSIPGFSGENPKIIPNNDSHYLDGNAIGRFVPSRLLHSSY